MKRFLLLLSALAPAVLMHGQTLSVSTGAVTTVFNAAEAGQMTYGSNGSTLTIGGRQFNVAEIDSITASPTGTVTPATVGVTYAGASARVTVSSDILPHLTITANGADVSIVADATLADEVTYTLRGTSADGSFYMDGAYKASFVLDNLTLTNAHGGGAVTIDCGKRINISVPDGTTTTLADAAGGTQKACFFINGHAELKGGGTLNVAGLSKHAYASDEYTWLKPSFGTLNVTSAANDGLHVQQYFRMDGGTVSVSSATGDCIDVSITKDATDEFNGQALINAGTITLNVASDDTKGLKADSAVTLAGGTLQATVAGDGAKGISAGTDLLISQKTDAATLVNMDVTGTTYHKDEADESKCRGIKVKGNFTFDGGTISMNVTGKKAKGISVDGTYTYVSGTTNVLPE